MNTGLGLCIFKSIELSNATISDIESFFFFLPCCQHFKLRLLSGIAQIATEYAWEYLLSG